MLIAWAGATDVTLTAAGFARWTRCLGFATASVASSIRQLEHLFRLAIQGMSHRGIETEAVQGLVHSSPQGGLVRQRRNPPLSPMNGGLRSRYASEWSPGDRMNDARGR